MTDDLHVEAERTARRIVRRRRIVQGASGVVVACLSVASTIAIQQMSTALDDRDVNARIAQAYSQQLISAGLSPTVDPSKIKGEKGPKGDTGATGPSVSAGDVARAVRSYCRGGRCKGSPGQTGPAVTARQVAAAVRVYCTANGRCQGHTGATGAAGTPGLPGVQGPPPTDKQISEAVEAFCAGGSCRGATGATGEPGPQGEQGPKGDPGPACPDGYTAATRIVVTAEAPLGEPAVLCLPTPM